MDRVVTWGREGRGELLRKMAELWPKRKSFWWAGWVVEKHGMGEKGSDPRRRCLRGRARSFKTSSKVSGFSEVPWETADSFQVGKEGDKTCATLQSHGHLGFMGIWPRLSSPASHLLLPSTFRTCRFLFYLEVKDQGRIVLWKSSALPLASVKYELMTWITFQNFLSALETGVEWSKCSPPRKSLVLIQLTT